jgi:hypothetical protein
VTAADLDELARLVAASEALSPAPWRQVHGAIVDARVDLVTEDAHGVDEDAIIALRNAAPELLSLAREGLAAREAARETYRVEEDDECWCALARGKSLEWCRGYIAVEPASGYPRRIVRERDGEVVT